MLLEDGEQMTLPQLEPRLGWRERGHELTGSRGIMQELGNAPASSGQRWPGFDRTRGEDGRVGADFSQF